MATVLRSRERSLGREPITRRATNVSIDDKLVDDAKDLGVNISRACEEGLRKEVKRVFMERWVEENRASFDAFNEYVAENGLPLAKYRMF